MNSVETKTKVEQIVKFVNSFYNPWRIKVVDLVIADKKNYVIGVYFKEIPKKYISDGKFRSERENREVNLTKEIKTFVENYLGITTKSSHTSKDSFLVRDEYPITIVVQSEK